MVVGSIYQLALISIQIKSNKIHTLFLLTQRARSIKNGPWLQIAYIINSNIYFLQQHCVSVPLFLMALIDINEGAIFREMYANDQFKYIQIIDTDGTLPAPHCGLRRFLPLHPSCGCFFFSICTGISVVKAAQSKNNAELKIQN